MILLYIQSCGLPCFMAVYNDASVLWDENMVSWSYHTSVITGKKASNLEKLWVLWLCKSLLSIYSLNCVYGRGISFASARIECCPAYDLFLLLHTIESFFEIDFHLYYFASPSPLICVLFSAISLVGLCHILRFFILKIVSSFLFACFCLCKFLFSFLSLRNATAMSTCHTNCSAAFSCCDYGTIAVKT